MITIEPIVLKLGLLLALYLAVGDVNCV